MSDIKKSFAAFFKVKFLELRKMTESVKYVGLFSGIFFYWTCSWLVYAILYPLTRLFLNKEKAIIFCDSLLKMPSVPQPISLPKLTKAKLMLKEKVDWDVFIEVYLRDVYEKNTLQSGLTVIDIGAHVGLYSVLAAERVRTSGKVVAVEPAPKNYERLTENIAVNNFANVVTVKIALSDHQGSEQLYIASLSICNSLDKAIVEESGAFSSTTVSVNTLDNLLKELNVSKVDIIKIDAEGSEMAILQGAKETLRHNPHVKLLVASYHYPKEIQEVSGFLHSFGFKPEVSLPGIIITN